MTKSQKQLLVDAVTHDTSVVLGNLRTIRALDKLGLMTTTFGYERVDGKVLYYATLTLAGHDVAHKLRDKQGTHKGCCYFCESEGDVNDLH